IAAAPSFPGLRRFPEGRGFKQWTGDDSKALMKVRRSSWQVCFLANHLLCTRFTCPQLQLFGAPNGLCSSITESKHIKAVKDPYRRTNHNKPLGQMLLINQRLDKLTADRSDFTARNML
ncbi:hypothetical protein OF83DRAFT_1019582, partial [Amylostereum chailletii]